MSNDALLWNAPPPPPRKPRPAEHVWSMRKNGKWWTRRGHGEYGWECQFLYNGELAYGRRWNLRADALAEAEEKRQELSCAGWQQVEECQPQELANTGLAGTRHHTVILTRHAKLGI